MKAYHIVAWKRKYELTAKKAPAKEDTPFEDLRLTPIPYIRYSDNGLLLSPSYRRLAKHGNKLGVMMGISIYGLYWKLVDIARDKVRDYRGWILDENNYPLDPEHIADILEIKDRTYVKKAFALLVYLGKLELLEVPAHFPIPADSTNSIQQREFLEPFKNETETEDKEKFKRKDSIQWSELNGPDPLSVARTEPPSPGPPSDKDSVKDSGDTASVTVSVPQGGQGREEEMAKARQVFLMELSDIIVWRNQSDRTTLGDIAEQLTHRQIFDTDLPLFNEAIAKARGCAKVGKNPLAMFVAAMKQSPFNYVPRNRSFIRAKKDKYHV